MKTKLNTPLTRKVNKVMAKSKKLTGGGSIKLPPGPDCHLYRIKKWFNKRVDEKYRKGWKEHGGTLLEYEIISLYRNLVDEIIDLVVYMETILEKRNMIDDEN